MEYIKPDATETPSKAITYIIYTKNQACIITIGLKLFFFPGSLALPLDNSIRLVSDNGGISSGI